MPVTVEEVQKIMSEQFPGADVRGIWEKDHRVLGSIVWKGFKKMDRELRHQLLDEKVRERLGMRGINIGVLHPMAPGEKL